MKIPNPVLVIQFGKRRVVKKTYVVNLEKPYEDFVVERQGTDVLGNTSWSLETTITGRFGDDWLLSLFEHLLELGALGPSSPKAKRRTNK
jgi:hypothetical protein